MSDESVIEAQTHNERVRRFMENFARNPWWLRGKDAQSQMRHCRWSHMQVFNKSNKQLKKKLWFQTCFWPPFACKHYMIHMEMFQEVFTPVS